ncbi:MAG: YgiT-type zinc finger protein [bacterium]
MVKKKQKSDKDFDRYNKLIGDEIPSECENCGSSLTLEKVNLEDYQGGRLYMMEQVPAYACQSCGEIFVPGPIILEFENMIKTIKQRKTQKGTKGGK